MEPTTPPPPLVPGFELGAVLGRGATAEVWEAVRESDGRRVAVKVTSADPEAVEAAAREASVTGRVAAEHLLAVEACLALPDGRAALVLPLMRGGSLASLVAARGHLSPGEVVTVLAPVAAALGRLHAAGVVHGDVSPGNVLLDLGGRPVLADLGLGHVLGEAPTAVWGTEGHLAPEVVLGASPDAAADVYALGALGWLCLSGAVPGPPGLRPALAEVSRAGATAAGLVALVESAVAPDPLDRPGADELAVALFDAAPALPLRLVDGDAVEAVTYRLRAAAAEPVEPDEPAPRTGSVRRRATQGVRRVRSAVGAGGPGRPGRRRRLGPGRHRGHTTAAAGEAAGRAGGSGSALGRGVVTGVVAIALTAGVAGWAAAALDTSAPPAVGRPREAAVPAPGSPRAPSAPVTHSPSPSSPSPSSSVASSTAALRPAPSPGTADPRRDPTAARERPSELLTVLARSRAQAWRSADVRLLVDAESATGPLHARDAAGVQELARAGLRYDGLQYELSDVRFVRASGDLAVVSARVGVTAYEVVGEGPPVPRAATDARPVVVELVRTTDGWRIRDLLAD